VPFLLFSQYTFSNTVTVNSCRDFGRIPEKTASCSLVTTVSPVDNQLSFDLL